MITCIEGSRALSGRHGRRRTVRWYLRRPWGWFLIWSTIMPMKILPDRVSNVLYRGEAPNATQQNRACDEYGEPTVKGSHAEGIMCSLRGHASLGRTQVVVPRYSSTQSTNNSTARRRACVPLTQGYPMTSASRA